MLFTLTRRFTTACSSLMPTVNSRHQCPGWRLPRIGLPCLIAIALLCGQTSGQTTTAAPLTLGTPTRASLPHLYWHLLMYQNHLDSIAADHEKQGKDSVWLQFHLQQRLGFTDAEFAPVRESAQRLEKTIAGIDAKAKAIIKAGRAQYGKGLLPSGVQPPGWEQLKELNQERETAIADEISKLNDALGADDAAKLQEYIEKEFSSDVTASPIHPTLHFPHKNGSQSSQQEAQP
jgi:hypothetical protein